MKLKQIPLALALALAMGALASGCAQDPQPAADTGTTAEAAQVEAAHADADAHAAADDHDASHADAIANAGGTDFPVPGNHVKWTPDAPLVEGMSRVRTALEGLESESHPDDAAVRSEEHTSELQSLMRISYAVFCLKKTKHTNTHKAN